MNISTNFTLSEAMRSGTALRLGIDNTPPDILLPAIKGVAEHILEPVRSHYGVGYSPNGLYRCEDLERALCWGGRNQSSFGQWCNRHGMPIIEESWVVYFSKKQHPKGNAVDFELSGVPNIDLAYWCRDNLEYDQLIMEFYNLDDPAGGWVHCSHIVGGPNRGEVLTISKGGTVVGLPDRSV